MAREELSPAACSMVTQLARETGAYVVVTGRAADPQTALDFGAQEFVDLENDVDRAQLSEIVQRVRDGRVRANVGNVATFDDAVAACNPTSDARGSRSSAFAREDSDGERSLSRPGSSSRGARGRGSLSASTSRSPSVPRDRHRRVGE